LRTQDFDSTSPSLSPTGLSLADSTGGALMHLGYLPVPFCYFQNGNGERILSKQKTSLERMPAAAHAARPSIGFGIDGVKDDASNS
jgi:hypothetical protein